jgi:transposase-like protein
MSYCKRCFCRYCETVREKRTTKDKSETAREMYEEGYTYSQIGKVIGFKSKNAVFKLLKKNGFIKAR